ncbi:MAG: malto-oligosyltrehalose synthase, partial [Desulfobacterales bacterium]|nr:malto-oligosyltrehalose synthase [Desulfobacterales bacterium]
EGRVEGFLEKAMREAKVHTAWTRPNEAYEKAVKKFSSNILKDVEFRGMLENFTEPLVYPGRVNSLSQLLVKLTAPGVPDIFQGMETWNLSLVDPDNRRAVDFSMLRRMLGSLNDMTLEEIMGGMNEGFPKMWVLRKTLELRKERHQVFQQGTYRSLDIVGEKAEHAVAYLRGEEVITLVPRLPFRNGGKWGDTRAELPDGRWRNQLTGEIFEREAPLQDIWARFPVALMSRDQ